ncbi:hypothetical protein [Photobacterium leiognathi]|uniref:hypothetical protein n=1 Tax=Photobacterium leiognathi TaxID=553611 RepID=UPI00298117B7|nr:hypothetical protein [Photobacterium leiognathi]
MSKTTKLINEMETLYETTIQEFAKKAAYKEALNDSYKRIVVVIGNESLTTVKDFILSYNDYKQRIIDSSETITANSKIFNNHPVFISGTGSVQLKLKQSFKTYTYTGARLARKLQLLRRSRKEKADKELLDDEMLFFRKHKDEMYVVRKEGYSELTALLTMNDGSQKKHYVKKGILFLYEAQGNVLVKQPAESLQFGVRKPRNKYNQLIPIATALDLNGKLYSKSAIDNIYRK